MFIEFKDLFPFYRYVLEHVRDKDFFTNADIVYINGIYEDELYITDIDLKKQYKFNPDDEVFEEIGNKVNGYPDEGGIQSPNCRITVAEIDDFFLVTML